MFHKNPAFQPQQPSDPPQISPDPDLNLQTNQTLDSTRPLQVYSRRKAPPPTSEPVQSSPSEPQDVEVIDSSSPHIHDYDVPIALRKEPLLLEPSDFFKGTLPKRESRFSSVSCLWMLEASENRVGREALVSGHSRRTRSSVHGVWLLYSLIFVGCSKLLGLLCSWISSVSRESSLFLGSGCSKLLCDTWTVPLATLDGHAAPSTANLQQRRPGVGFLALFVVFVGLQGLFAALGSVLRGLEFSSHWGTL
ncbi:uncharacterized protein G2W53_039850 [Senna tora]|uniref:Uncharacterized protein n=1 Tax=Senna tora TaxID=362788 RepID=A0A834T1X1_9FABA|nr:uncharacterized protein G2W53_039850 [Senna tora]